MNGISYPILAPQTSFGMILDHVGALTGWEHGIEFPRGALKQKITPNFFRIHVPNHGKIKTSVKVRALEPGETPEGTGGGSLNEILNWLKKLPWWAWLLLVFLLLLLLVLK